MIRVLVVDDQALVRLGLRTLIATEPDLDVVGEAGDGPSAVAAAREHRPDVILLDVRMPGLNGIATLRRISADPDLTGVRVIILTTFDLDDYIFEALRAGAAGFLTKDAEPDEIVRAIRLVASGDALLSPSVTRRVIARFTGGPGDDLVRRPHPALHLLTGRERELVGWVATGLSNEDIAVRLVLSPATVRTHVGRAMAKLGARDRAQLVVIAYQSGIVVPAD